MPLNHNNLPIDNTLIRSNVGADDPHELLIQFRVVHRVSREQFDLVQPFVGLESLPVELGLHVVQSFVCGFVEVGHLLFTGQHGSDRKEDFDIVVKRNLGVFELLASLEQTVGQIKVVSGVGVESIEHSVKFDANLEVLQNDADDPFDLFSC